MERINPEGKKSKEQKYKKLRGRELLEKKEEILESGGYLKIEECKDGYLYVIMARHANVGIYDEKKQTFITNRKKFEENFLFGEDHWDTGEPHGTAIPLKEIEKAPDSESDEQKLEYLKEKAEELAPEIENLL